MTHTPFSKKNQITVSLIIPFYNEVENIGALHQRLSAVAATLPERVEVLYVNDGSSDHSALAVEALDVVHYEARLINLSRNFGKEAAMQAGFDHCRGDVVVQLDADLQDPPELLPRMLAAYYQGADVVNMRRLQRRGESWLKRHSAALFHRLCHHLADAPIHVDVGDFRLLSRRVLDHLNQLPERNRYMKGLLSWPGFRQVTLEFERPARVHGVTKWSTAQLASLALAGLTAFSNKPLRFITWCSLPILILALGYGGFLLLQSLWLQRLPSMLETLLLVQLGLGGGLFLAMGVLGEYIGRILTEVQQRPLYLVAEQTELNALRSPIVMRKLG